MLQGVKAATVLGILTLVRLIIVTKILVMTVINMQIILRLIIVTNDTSQTHNSDEDLDDSEQYADHM